MARTVRERNRQFGYKNFSKLILEVVSELTVFRILIYLLNL
jgi:hypothetical protein